MAREDLHFRLRIPEDLKLRVQKAAESNHRSMTAEIVAILEEKLPPTLSKQEILGRSVIVAHMMRRLVKNDEMTREAYMEVVAPIFYILKKHGYEGTSESLEKASLDENLASKLSVVDLMLWIDEIKKDFETHYPSDLFGTSPPPTPDDE